MSKFLLFYVTHPDESTARSISRTLLDEHWIACANLFPIGSMYRWEGVVEQADEWVSILKTTLKNENAVEQRLRELHPYQTPCLMRYEVQANSDYVAWIEQSCV